MSYESELQRANRLNTITQRIGFALWQLQELEDVAAMYLVLVTKAQRGMGLEAGNSLVEQAQSKTFGVTVRAFIKSKVLPPEIEQRFSLLLNERNWMVHNSKASSSSAVDSDDVTTQLLSRLENIEVEALALIKELHKLTEQFVQNHGITKEEIEKELSANAI